ncbi:MAG: thioredoxin domain-containing protein [Patescibacteria group bacterium]|nr:thioredoxin domain-containing protein [Patescibacteria group bacterium]
MSEEIKKSQYQTHWHSFWFGFMSALAVVLFFLLIGTITNRVSFGDHAPTKRVAITKSDKKDVSKAPTENETAPPVSQSVSAIIGELGIDAAAFDTCMDEKRYEEAVKDDIKGGQEAGVEGTPHSFVLIDSAVYEIPGAQTEEGVREFFDDLLAGKDPRAKDISATRTVAPVTTDDWVRGDDDARITVIEYTDVDCPFCKKFHTSTTNIMEDYPNDVKWVFRHMPSDGLHPQARMKAEASECIGELGGAEAFWQYIDKLLI